MRAGLEQGQAPRAVALDVVGRINKATGKREGGLIGLTSGQAEWVMNARAELLSGRPADLRNYLTRTRRDRRYDAMVRRALAEGRPLTVKDADLLTGRYKDRLLKMRGDTIARTESINALRAGQWEGYQQLVDSGQVRADQITRKWQATGDDRTRHDHMTMNGQTVKGMDAPFVAPDGSRLMFPGDTSLGASPAQTIQCRCFAKVRIKYL